MEVRKLQKTGGSTYVISLPKSWVKNSGLDSGSILTVREQQDGSVLITPGEITPHRKLATIDAGPYVNRRLLEKYLLGYDEVTISSNKGIPEKEKSKIKNTVNYLIGYEIMDESANSLTIQNLLNPVEVSVFKSLKRMQTIVSVMHRDLISAISTKDKKLLKDVIQRDTEVNRLYFLVVRQIRTIIQTPSLQDKEGLKSVDYVDYRLAANLLEVTGDALSRIASKSDKMSSSFNTKLFLDLLEKTQVLHKQATTALFKKDIDLASQAMELFDTLELNGIHKKSNIDVSFDLFHEVKQLASIGKDIADMAVSE